MKIFFQKGLIAFLLATFLSTLFSNTALAGDPYNDSIDCWIEVGEFKAICPEGWVAKIDSGIKGAQIADILGPVEGIHCTGEQCKTTFFRNMAQSSFLAAADKTILAIYQNPPATTYIAATDFGKSLGLLPNKAFAQGPGIGFSGLSPLLPIWKVFRNIAYFLLAIVMVAIGFMVMFRQKIDPKTVVTVQSALPNVIIALLLITFSYAIVGILIDIMYLSIVLVVSLIVPAGQSLVGNEIIGSNTLSNYLSAEWGTIIGAMFHGGIQTVDDLFAFVGSGAVLTTVGIGVLAAFINPVVGVGIATTSILAVLLVGIILFFAALRLLFVLLSSYIQLIIALLTAPLLLLAVAIPGSNAFQSWFMNIISNLVVFPITAVLILIATILAAFEKGNWEAFAGATAEPSLWAPPFLSSGKHGMAGLIALGILLSIPTIVNSIKESFKAKQALPLAGAAPFIGIASTAGTYGFQYFLARKQSQEMAKTLKDTIGRKEPGSTTAPPAEAGSTGH